MVKQYPHTLIVTTVDPGSRDANGDWVPGTQSEKTLSCRAESNDKGKLISNGDGVSIVYDWILYLPNPISGLALGSRVEVRNGDALMLINNIKRISTGQLNSRIWL